MKVLLSLLLFISLNNDCNRKALDIGITKVKLINHGNQKEIILKEKDKKTLMDLILKIVNGYENNISLMVTGDKLRSIFENSKSLEVSFSSEIDIKNASGIITKANQVLLIFEGELSSPPDQESCLFLLSNARGFMGNAFNSPKGNKVVGKIREMLGI